MQRDACFAPATPITPPSQTASPPGLLQTGSEPVDVVGQACVALADNQTASDIRESTSASSCFFDNPQHAGGEGGGGLKCLTEPRSECRRT